MPKDASDQSQSVCLYVEKELILDKLTKFKAKTFLMVVFWMPAHL